MLQRIGILTALFAPLACGAPHNSDATAPALLTDSRAVFVLDPAAKDGDVITVTDSQVTLQRSALGKAFLMSPSLVTAGDAPAVMFSKPKLVQFEQHGSALALVDANPRAIYTGLPVHKLLQTFEVAAETSDTIAFRWDFGLRSVPRDMPYDVSDFGGGFSGGSIQTAWQVQDSYLKSMTVRGETLELCQVARVVAGEGRSSTVQVSFRLQPASTNPRFTPRLSTRQHGVGFFEVETPRPGDGASEYYAMRWDLTPEAGPLTYAITADVPADLKDAVRTGILYWNRVAGREIVRVETGADPGELPSPRRVLVRWVPWKQAGFAMAGLQAHPLTGEMQAAEVFMTNSWASFGEMNVRLGLEAPARAITVEGFEPAEGCHLGDAVARRQSLQVLAAAPDPTVVQRGIRDQVRSVVAHEVGHTLGLRHNFAASQESSLPDTAALHAAWSAYLHHAGPGVATTTSVMDYSGANEDFLLGAYIEGDVLPYDRAALAWGYDKETLGPDAVQAPLFCTDSETRGLVGCAPRDSGRNPLAGYLEEFAAQREMLGATIVHALVEGFTPEYPGDAMSTDRVVARANPDLLAGMMFFSASPAFFALTPRAEVLSVKRRLLVERTLDPEAYERATVQQLDDWLQAVGGLPGWLARAYGLQSFSVVPSGWLVDDVTARLRDDAFAQGSTLDGRHYALSPEAAQAIRTYAPRIAARLEQAVLRDLLAAFTGDLPSLFKRPGGDDGGEPKGAAKVVAYRAALAHETWQEPLGALAVQLIAGTADPVRGTVGDRPVEVPAPRFHEDLRLQAVRLLSPHLFARPSWLRETRRHLTEATRDRALLVAVPGGKQGAPGASMDLVIPPGVSPELEAWTRSELRVLTALLELVSDGE